MSNEINKSNYIEVKPDVPIRYVDNNLLDRWVYPYIPELMLFVLSIVLIYIKRKLSTLEISMKLFHEKHITSNIDAKKALELQEILYNILHQTNADRVCLLEFHNGVDRGSQHISYIKFSITFEVVKPSVSKISNIIRDISKTLLVEELDKLQTNDYIILNSETTPQSNILINGIGEIYMFKITNNLEDGIVLLIYNHHSKCLEDNINICLNDDDGITSLSEIRLLCSSIQYYLNY